MLEMLGECGRATFFTCCSFAAEALLSGGAGRLAGAAQAPEAQLALEAFQRVD